MNYQEWIFKIKHHLENVRKQAVKLTAEVIGQTLCEDDFYMISILDKCIRLIDGFAIMIEKRYYYEYRLTTVYGHMHFMQRKIKLRLSEVCIAGRNKLTE